MADNARKLVEDVLSLGMTREIWSGNYDKVLPVSVQNFELSSILPAVFYMFRFGQRRGKGKFLETFGLREGSESQKRRSATVDRVAGRLSSKMELDGFDGEPEKAILGDLLLCFCLENIRHNLGRDQQIQRVSPAHYMASWIDLPDSVAHLRYIPEMIVAMLSDQPGESVGLSDDKKRTWFPVGKNYEENVLLGAFSQGVTRRGDILNDLASDRFEEADDSVGLDQLLMVRLAQQLGTAPDKMRGKEAGPISNQRPIAEQAARSFSEDIRRFVRSYADPVPRHSLVEMLESCVAIGLNTILTSTVELLLRWSKTGVVLDREKQHPAPLLIDCSNGVERSIRAAAEQSMDDYMRRMERFPVLLMVLRLLDYRARDNRQIKKQDIATRPYATDWLNLLGDLLHDRHPQARRILDRIEDDADKLAEELSDDYSEAAEILDNDTNQENPVWRLADGLMALMGRKFQDNFMKMIDSSLLTGRPNGLAARRTTTRGLGGSTTRRKRDIRSLVFTDSVLDYLVHLHLLKSGNKPGIRALSFKEFLDVLRERYGFHVDTAPSEMTISNELLQRNRTILEQRLRDLGLLVGVNDAEAMKRLEPRFKPTMEN
ncbi:MAG: hypothetical protein OXH81_05855 [Gemmatimonadetes bacterium]|nr:hypothetical protein [Gemmatimonadota bacterium]